MINIYHRFYDLLIGGAEVVILNTVRAFPDCVHHLFFNRFKPSWISRTLETLPNVRLHRIAVDSGFAFPSQIADLYLFHFYPPMNEGDFRDLPSWILSRSVLVNHWCDRVPYLPRIRYLFLSDHSRKFTGPSIPDDLCYIVLNPVSDDYFQLHDRPAGRFILGRHSRDVPIKFSRDFFDIFESYRQANLEVTVLGTPQKMVEFVSANLERLQHNYWLLPFNSMPVRKYLRGIDAFVYKTRDDFEETCPMNILEALASGLPVIAERKGGIVNLVRNEETGFLCSSITEFHDAIDLLRRDVDMRLKFGDSARRWAAQFASLQIFRKQLECICRDIISPS